MKLLQLNVTVNSGSTGRIAEDIGKVMIMQGHESAIAFGRGNRPSQSQKIKIGTKWDIYSHVIQTRLLDNHGFASKKATVDLIKKIEAFQPDIIGLHNLHGYYLHVGKLFEYLKRIETPVIWTLHDCWAFTGHCSHFMSVKCKKWKTHCQKCPLSRTYPSSWFRDRSYQNFEEKRRAFTDHPNLTIVTPSNWLKAQVNQSYLKDYPVHVIHNGIDLNTFHPNYNKDNKKLVLGVASIWTDKKGLMDFFQLRKLLDDKVDIILIGLSKSQMKKLPKGIKGIARTESVEELANWYSRATLFVNPTYVDNFPTTNIEALACGTPVVTYDTGGSPEAIDEHTGLVVEKGNQNELANAVIKVLDLGKESFSDNCRLRAERYFNKDNRYLDYLNLYNMYYKNNEKK